MKRFGEMLSEQWRKILILTFFCLVSVNSLSKVGKCCPTGKMFVGSATIECMEMPNARTELYTLNSSDHRGLKRSHGFPECGQREYLATTPLADLTSSDYIQSPACVELLHQKKPRQSMPLLVNCRTGEDRNESDATPSVSLPEVLEVRRCCPKGSAYVHHTKRCVPLPEAYVTGNLSESNEFLSLLPKTISVMDFLVVSREPLECTGTVYDYEADAADLTIDNRSLYITLPVWKNASEEERISLSDRNSCLELSGDPNSSKKLVVRACQSLELCRQHICVRKCCLEDEYMSATDGKCNRFDNATMGLDFHQAVQNFSIPSNYGVLLGNICKFGMYPLNPLESSWSFTPEGHIHMYDDYTYLHHEYCMEIASNSSHFEGMLYLFFCFGDPALEGDPISPIRYNFNATLQAISCMFLLTTLLVYVYLPELQNLHGKTLMCHVASLLLAYICLVCVPWVTPKSFFWNTTKEGDGAVICPLVGYTMLFAFLSAFSWLNVMCFDIWWTFGGLRGHSTRGRGHLKKFLIYCLYAWGLPILLTGLALLADKTEILPLHLRPNVSLMSCWFPKLPNFYGEMPFFVGPILTQLVANMVFFALTAIHCSQVKDELKRINASDVSDSRSKRFYADRTKLVMNVKLFVVMGLSWVTEIASFFVNKYASEFMWREEVFYVTDSFNCLQGLFIFMLFVMKARVYQALRKRLGWEKRKPMASQGTTALQDQYRIKQNGSSSSNNTSSTLVVGSQCC